MALEEEAQIQERLGEQLPVLEQQRDEQAADAAIAVEIGMDGFELHVHERGADERRELRLAVDVLLQVTQERAQLLRRRWNEDRVARAGAADPVLAAAQFTWLFRRPAHTFHQPPMRFIQETGGQRETLLASQLLARIGERGEVVRDLLHVVRRLVVARGRAGLVGEQVDQTRLRALDL